MASFASPAAGDSQSTPKQTSQQTTTTVQPDTKPQEPTTAPVSTDAPKPDPAQQQPKQSTDDDGDDDSDFDDLDEVLDDFKPKSQADTPAPQLPTGASDPSDFDESAFMSQLEKDMARMMGQAAQQSGVSDSTGFEDTINQGADEFTKQLEESGIAPGDFIKQLLADVMAEEEDGKGQSSGSPSTSASGAAAAGSASGAGAESFNDAIQQTINRIKESGDKATAAASEDNTDDLIAQLLKAMEAGGDGSGGDEGDLTKIFMGMMEQLSNKDMLYEPMKELDTKFGPWIQENRGKGKVAEADMERYEKQAELVAAIVKKFEEPGYTDEDAKCREYVWEKMQAMQAAGNPPDELVANPWMDDLKGGGGMPDCPQQ
ncbi:putative peroxisomal membrane protein receptor Pex19 [Aspergillus mulundensis]|uniref:Microbody (Peroxisome) biogenesis protein peroxin 19 n=1 Tax=Aspergillus mulundensis TaxID=1810919 RepID=A0A3D8SJ73_9EURO|nr:Microbody (Peroxisome) biogenesis protein peroxin 19 [Aspergillus mulundensis]RDW86336.1 Microbody (Peroxisome) biogenesis protein peroxin 19 [Aspergillus mulundensis]